MRERHWYSRFGIEPPFPWPAFVLIPVGWITRALEWLVRPGKNPTPVDVIESRENLGPYHVPEYFGWVPVWDLPEDPFDPTEWFPLAADLPRPWVVDLDE
ncbi:hypothetical protein JF714_15750 [Mycobacterium avium]|uniref:hypothetical protein n=1 Tax=Mycobacterium avium TaxID=1764 RepID=UPI001CDA8D00|nr:hypothetical protein [Mycobacterium avium]MCA2331897.1 hypothetical protein [Mycobacterium avium]